MKSCITDELINAHLVIIEDELIFSYLNLFFLCHIEKLVLISMSYLAYFNEASQQSQSLIASLFLMLNCINTGIKNHREKGHDNCFFHIY